MKINFGTDSGQEVVSVADFLAFAKIDVPPNDGIPEYCINAAVSYVEREANVSLSNKFYYIWWDEFPEGNGKLYIPLRPFVNVSSFSYNVDGVETDLIENVDYKLGGLSNYTSYFIPVTKWPSMFGSTKLITMYIETGFSDTDATVATPPQDLKMAVLMLASHWYEQRTATSPQAVNKIPYHVQSILNRWHLQRV